MASCKLAAPMLPLYDFRMLVLPFLLLPVEAEIRYCHEFGLKRSIPTFCSLTMAPWSSHPCEPCYASSSTLWHSNHLSHPLCHFLRMPLCPIDCIEDCSSEAIKTGQTLNGRGIPRYYDRKSFIRYVVAKHPRSQTASRKVDLERHGSNETYLL